MSRKTTDEQFANSLKAELAHFTGDSERYRHGLNRRVIYTPGIRHLAERASAYWLVNAIAIWLASPEFRAATIEDDRVTYLHFWKLEVAGDRSALLTARADSGVAPFITQQIEFTNFPLAEIDIWVGFDGEHRVLYLPSEH